MTFQKFSSLPMTGKLVYVQNQLKRLGYYDGETHGKRDKLTIKAIMKFQKDNGLGTNGVVCEKTFKPLE